VVLLALLLTALAGEPCPTDGLVNAPPAGFVDLRAAVPGVRLEIRYHTADNFTGAPLPGYGAPGAWLLQAPAAALAAVQADLAKEGLGLLVYDAYRPLRGTLGMVAWAERTGQTHYLDDGYVARRSNHNRGNTVDLTLVDLATGRPLEMGTPWDTLTPAAHTASATGIARTNRDRLVAAMRRHGWVNYWKEWWHFTWSPDEKPAPRDVPYACFEPAEGRWQAPAGWNRAGYRMPTAWPADAACPANPAKEATLPAE
jgi:D-alanyl-D-alanine dipeptidase